MKKINMIGVVGPDKKGLYHFKKRTPAPLLKFYDKAELWIDVGTDFGSTAMLLKYEQINNNIDEAIAISKFNGLTFEAKKLSIIQLIDGTEFNFGKLFEKPSGEIPDDRKLSNLIKSFAEFKRTKVDKRTLSMFKVFSDVILAFFGDIDVETIRTAQFTKFETFLSEFPNRKLSKFKKLTLDEAIKIKAKQDEAMYIDTRNRFTKNLKSLLIFYRNNFNNEFGVPAFKVEKEKRKMDDLMDCFTKPQLKNLMTGDDIFAKVSRVLYFTGLRPSEIVKSKIITIDGIETISLKFKDTKILVKSTSSQRYIPLHSSIKSDFLEVAEYIKTFSQGWLSRIFNRYLRDKGFSDTYTMYSLRRSFANELKINQINPHIVDELMGHKISSLAGRTYAGEAPISQKKTAIETLSF